MGTKIWRTATATGMTAAALLSVAVTAPPAAARTCAIQPYGLIGDYWRALGGADSWFGCATVEEYTPANMTGRKQRFEHGQIAWSPKQGERMIVAAFQKNKQAVFRWGPTDPFHYEYFQVTGDLSNGGTVLGTPMPGGTSGRYAVNVGKGLKITFWVHGCDEVFPVRKVCRQGWTLPVSVTMT
ncbi:hypothetical protein Aph01nite_46130 [Acrocarpospora phusangensis]|uniref:Secreted protein n=1 Tax=Acrocarpospora phusangensis TaxID=1070424 RepID=A0A919QCR2_9ACTN|nr:hypothetical protein [Acrocarpospora phusangensis]GIH26303.1 hypothetical protein Aph01nite_46130 [Acrocarpospora phusangensis]